jgi:hypothetical protein
MATLADVHALVSEYLHRSIGRSAFAKRFAELFYGVESSHDEEAIEFCYAIDSRIAEASIGLITEETLRASLDSYLNSARVTIHTVTISSSYIETLFPPKRTEATALYEPAEVEFANA